MQRVFCSNSAQPHWIRQIQGAAFPEMTWQGLGEKSLPSISLPAPAGSCKARDFGLEARASASRSRGQCLSRVCPVYQDHYGLHHEMIVS